MRKSQYKRGKRGSRRKHRLSFSISLFPGPGGGHDVINIKSGIPSKALLSSGIVGIDGHDVTGSAWTGRPLQFFTCCFFKGLDRFQYCDAGAAPQIDGFTGMLFCFFFQYLSYLLYYLEESFEHLYSFQLYILSIYQYYLILYQSFDEYNIYLLVI